MSDLRRAPGLLLLALALSLFVASCSSGPKSREEFLDEEWREAAKMYKQIWAELIRDLPPAERSVAESIDLQVWKSDYVGAASRLDKGRRLVIVLSANLRVVDLAIDAETIEVVYGRKGFAARYAKYVSKAKAANDRLREANRPVNFILTPAQYGRYPDSVAESFLENPQLKSGRLDFRAASLSFILSHELAHHLLEHVGQPLDGNQRYREAAADKWATRLLIKKGMIPYFAKYTLLIGAMAPVNSNDVQIIQDHPPEIDRITALFDASIEAMPAFARQMRSKGIDPDLYQEAMEEMHANLIEGLER